MDSFIKKQLREGLLQENYNTAKELSKLADQALTYWCKIWENNREVDINHEVYTVDFIQQGMFNVIEEFVWNCSIKIGFSTDIKPKGVCGSLNKYEHEITLKITPKEIEDMQDDLDYYLGDSESTFEGFLYWSTEKYKKVLVHELQHAYDGFRSNMNFANKQQGVEYTAKQYKANKAKAKGRSEWTDQDMKDVITHQRAYLRLDHEISARFVDTLSDMKVWKLEMGGGKRERVIIPWKDFYYDFKSKFMGWEEMKDAQKKSLKRKLAKAYYDAIEDFQELLKNKN